MWIKYKECEKTLRCRQRQEQYNYELNYITKIDEAEKIDQQLFWQLVKKRTKSKTNNICQIKKDYGEYVTDETAIREEWRAHFESIYTPDINNQDATFAKTVDDAVSTELASIKEDINNMADNFDIILPTEIEKISRSLKLNKACGYDSISSEH